MVTIGIDEAGRGTLAGPVVCGAVILNPEDPIDGLADSKKLSAKRREFLFDEIQSRALDYCIAHATFEEVDKVNVLQATFLSMQRAVAGLKTLNRYPANEIQILIDGNQTPDLPYYSEAIIKGDQKIAEISAASILAKVWRDREMVRLDAIYPEYGFARHFGYGTKLHMEALSSFGVTDIHRKTFAPVKRLLEIK